MRGQSLAQPLGKAFLLQLQGTNVGTDRQDQPLRQPLRHLPQCGV